VSLCIETELVSVVCATSLNTIRKCCQAVADLQPAIHASVTQVQPDRITTKSRRLTASLTYSQMMKQNWTTAFSSAEMPRCQSPIAVCNESLRMSCECCSPTNFASPVNHSTPLFTPCRPLTPANTTSLPISLECNNSPFQSIVTPVKGSASVPLILQYDMGWQKRSSGRAYNSLSGIGSMIGQNTGKIVGYGLRCKSCRFSSYWETKGRSPPEHACVINFTGSSKAMEPDVACEIVHKIDSFCSFLIKNRKPP